MAVTTQQVAELYVATFNRAPDAAGLAYWISDGTDATTTLTDINAIARAMQAGAEAESGVGSMTNAEYVVSLYSSMFGRTVAADSADVTYWVDQMTAGNVDRANLIQTLIAGAQASTGSATDAAILANKTTVGLAFAAAGLNDTTQATTVMASVTSDASTVSTALGLVSDYSNPGSTFALSSGVVSGTAGVDSITGTSATYAATTVLDGKAGTDTLTVTATDDVTATPTVINVENVNFNINAFSTTTGTTFAVATDNITATNVNVDVVQVGSAVVSAAITGLASGAVITASDDFTTAVTATGKTDNESLTVTSKATTVTANSTGTLTAATITGTNATAATLVTDTDGTATLTTTAADMTITAASATTVVATSAVGIDAATTNLTAATSVTLTALDDVDVDMTAAAAATISAGTVATNAVSTITDTTGTTLKTLNLSGNGSAVTFDVSTAAIDLDTINLSGSQNVTVKVSGANIDSTDVLAVTDNTTAGTTTVNVAVANVGNLNLASIAADNIQFTAAIANATAATFASGAAVQFAVDQTNAITVDGADATAATNTLTLTLDDGTHTGGAGVDITNMTITDFGSMTINASADDLKSTITTLTATADNTDVTINAGSLGVTIATTANLGTGDLVINSNGAVTLTGATVTAASVRTTGTGAVTMTTLDTSKVTTMATDAGADLITVSASNGNLTLNTGAGDDTVTWAAALATTTAKTYAFDAGEGTLDTFKIGDGADLTTGTSSVTLSNFERIDFINAAGGTTATVDNAMLSGKSYIITESSGAAVTVTVDLGTDTVSNLSTLVVDSANLSAATDGFIVSGAAATAAVTLTASALGDSLTGSAYADTITGGAGIDTIDGGAENDTISGGAGADIITGGTGNDTITAGEGADSITAGTGADTIVLTETTSAVDTVYIATATDGSAVGVAAGTFADFDVITGFTAGTDVVSAAVGVFTGTEMSALATAATVALNDLTATNYTSVDQVVNYIADLVANAVITLDADGTTDIFAVKFSNFTALYSVVDDAGGVVDATEIALLGTVDAVLSNAGDVVIA